MDSLQGRVGVVTGGASGIGRALAEALAREGAKVVVADLDEAGMTGVVAGIRGRGGEALAVRTDVADLASVRALADSMRPSRSLEKPIFLRPMRRWMISSRLLNVPAQMKRICDVSI